MKTSIGVKVGLVILNVHSRKRAQRFGSLTRISKLMSPLFNIQQFHVGLNKGRLENSGAHPGVCSGGSVIKTPSFLCVILSEGTKEFQFLNF